MGRTQHYGTRGRYEYSSDVAYDEYVQRTRSTKQVRHKKKSPSVSPSAPSNTFGERPWSEWEEDCQHWRGLVLEGRYAHWCAAWNNLPMDETCPEWPCGCSIVDEVDGGNSPSK